VKPNPGPPRRPQATSRPSRAALSLRRRTLKKKPPGGGRAAGFFAGADCWRVKSVLVFVARQERAAGRGRRLRDRRHIRRPRNAETIALVDIVSELDDSVRRRPGGDIDPVNRHRRRDFDVDAFT
jgi:hypothetical protein